MAQFAVLGLKGVGPAVENYEKVYDPMKNQGRKLKEKVMSPNKGSFDDQDGDYDDYDRSHRYEPRREHRRSRGGGDYEEETYERRVTGDRAKSAGRDPYGRGGRGLDRDDRRRRRHYSDSESSVSPAPLERHRRKSLGEQALALLGIGGAAGAAEHERERDRDRDRRRDRDYTDRRDRPRAYSREDYRREDDYRRDGRPRGAQSQDPRNRYVPAGYLNNGDSRDGKSDYDGTVATRNKGGNGQVATRNNGNFEEHRGEKRSSSSSSSDVCSSSEDDRRMKKMRGKEYLTAGLAAVATIHAAQGVYKSMEARDKRHEDVAKGEITEAEARKKRNKARLQDAAAIGIAALGIKGAYSEWQEVQEHREELAEQKKERQKRHEKRLRKAEKLSQRGYGGGYRRSEPDLNRRYRD